MAPKIAFLLNSFSFEREMMNEEGGIYRESFHLTSAKIMGFPGVKKSQKVTFFAIHYAPRAYPMPLGALGCGSHAPGAFSTRQALS